MYVNSIDILALMHFESLTNFEYHRQSTIGKVFGTSPSCASGHQF